MNMINNLIDLELEEQLRQKNELKKEDYSEYIV
jgi:hypothetical protein